MLRIPAQLNVGVRPFSSTSCTIRKIQRNRVVLHPKQFQVNEAWIAFQLNDAPIETGEGDFNCIAIIDAASCFILTSELVPFTDGLFSQPESQRILKQASSHKHKLPLTLFIANEWPANSLASEAEHQGVSVVRVPEEQLLLFIGEARQGFKERFGGRSVQ